MSRFRIGIASVVAMACAGFLPGVRIVGEVAAAAGDPSVETACFGTSSGSTFTLTADCDTTVSLTVPDGVTVDGAGHTITAHDPGPGVPFNGAVLTNAGTSMNIEDLTIEGTGFAVICGGQLLAGVYFNNASGSVTDTSIVGITEHGGCAGEGFGILSVAEAGVPRTVTVTSTTINDFDKSALVAKGMTTMNVSASTLGPPDLLPFNTIAQNTVQYGGVGAAAGAGGSITDSTIVGTGYGNASNQSIGVLLYGATGVTLMGDTTTGAGVDYGIDVTANTTGAVINANHIGRSGPDTPDTYGFGVNVDPGSTATVTCNTFSGWRIDLVGVPPQALCVTTTTLPSGTVTVPYSSALAAVGGTTPHTWSLASGSLPPGLGLSPSGIITGTPTAAGTFSFTAKVTDSVAATATETFTITVAGGTQGYWLGAADGGVFNFGVAGFWGSTGSMKLNAPVVGIANTARGGYWLVASDGGVFSYNAPFFGSMGGQPLSAPIVGIAATPDGGGYYLVGADGSVFPFGDAVFVGSMEGTPLNKPIVGIGVTPDNRGYYLVAADGGVFTFGDAVFDGSMGGKALDEPVVGIAVDTMTLGYWLDAADGGVFNFDAPFLGSAETLHLNAPVVGIAAGADDLGYRLTASDGGVFCFGTAVFFGSMGGKQLNAPMRGLASIGP